MQRSSLLRVKRQSLNSLCRRASVTLPPPPAHSGVAGGLANSEVRMWQSWLRLKNIQIIVFTSMQQALKTLKGLNHICKLCRVSYILLLWGAERKQNRLHRKCRWASFFHSSALSHVCSESSCPLWEDHRFGSQTRLCTSPFHCLSLFSFTLRHIL